MSRYVALGSVDGGRAGIRPPVIGGPIMAGRSARNYPHLVAKELGLDLVDVTYPVPPPRMCCGIPARRAAAGRRARRVGDVGDGDDRRQRRRLCADADGRRSTPAGPLVAAAGWRLGELLDPTRVIALVDVAESLARVGRTVRSGRPTPALFVDYLTCCRCRDRRAAAAGCRRRSAAASPTPWNGSPARPRPKPAVDGCGPRRPVAGTTPGLPNRGRPNSVCRCRATRAAAPNAAGMRAVAELVGAQATGHPAKGAHNAEGI